MAHKKNQAQEFRFIKWFNEIGINDVELVGGKNASLGEMFQNLTPKGIRIPDGFAITASAYFRFLKDNGLDQDIREILKNLDTQDVEHLRSCGKRIRQRFLTSKIPKEIKNEVTQAYRQLRSNHNKFTDVAVRSSATAEDLPDASFAGQQETYLNIEGDRALLDACLRCFASLFTDRAISYRRDKGFDDLKVGLSIGVQQMVRSDLAASGVMFSIDTETGFRDVVVINSSYGLGENIVQGSVNPDEYYVFKTTLKRGFQPILQKQLGNKEMKLIYELGGSKTVKNVPVPIGDRGQFSISDSDVLTLAQWACDIEDYYSQLNGKHVPMDMEWAKDGYSAELYIVQARPETVQSQKAIQQGHMLESYQLQSHSTVLLKGKSVGNKIGTGTVRVIKNTQDLGQLLSGEVLVTDKTDPDWEPAMKRAAAVVTNRGGRTCHAAIVSRELGLPAIVGTLTGTETLKTGQKVTVSCAQGEEGYVHEGELPFSIERVDVSQLKTPQSTKIMMNVGNPHEAFRLSFLPNSGVGLARMEFIISSLIGIHPLALINFNELSDTEIKNQIHRLTKYYASKDEYFVDRLAQGVGTIAAAFYPKDVIVRMSDFKSNEYAHLIGGELFEPHEENPMIGFRGASRYYDPRYRKGFALECRAMKKVREKMGLKNVKLMIPFCRTPDEGRKVIEEMKQNGLQQGFENLEVYMMCEIPSNVILAKEFVEIFDGFSIGSNDLTQLILGVDRDSELVAPIFDERNEAVKMMMAKAILDVHANDRKIGICGQGPSDYPELAQFLIENRIDSISLNPDVVLKTTRHIVEIEQGLPLTR